MLPSLSPCRPLLLVLVMLLAPWSLFAQDLRQQEEERIRNYVRAHIDQPLPLKIHPVFEDDADGFGQLSEEDKAAIRAQWTADYWRHRYFQENPGARNAFEDKGPPSCANGDFETGFGSYCGEFGSYYGGECDAVEMLGFSAIAGALGDDETMFKLTNNVADEWVTGLPQTHDGSAHAARINARRGLPNTCYPSNGVNRLTKQILVTEVDQTIAFYFALVLWDPNDDSHTNDLDRPFFNVRALNTSGQVQDEFCRIADVDNTFFQAVPDTTVVVDGCSTLSNATSPVIWAPWDCTLLNIGGQVGDTITLEFTVADCGKGGHWGYAYVDDICSVCPNPLSGLVQLDQQEYCGTASMQICGSYLPANQNGIPGTADNIVLTILQNGVDVTVGTIAPPVHDPVAHTFCFTVDPSNLPALSGGYDVDVAITFSYGNTENDENTNPGMDNDIVFTPEVCCQVNAPVIESCLQVSGGPEGDHLLDWSDVDGATGYQIQITTYSSSCCAGTTGVPQTTTISSYTAASIHPLENSNLFPCATWRVRAQCQEGTWSPWSAAECLCADNTCATQAPLALQCQHSATPGTGGQATLSWTPYTPSTQFEVQVTTFSQTCCPANSGLPTTTTFTTSDPNFILTNAGNYPCATWRVRERCYNAHWSPWSASQCLCAPAYCATTAPTGLACDNTNNSLTLSWANIPYAMQYEVLIRTHACPGCTPTGTSVQYIYTTNTNSISSFNQLLPASAYPCAQWRVRARCSNGTWSTSSAVQCVCANTSNCTPLIANGTFQTTSSSGPVTSCTNGVPQSWRTYQQNFSTNDSKIYVPLRGTPGVGGFTAFPNSTNPESHDAAAQNQRYMAFLCANSTAGTNAAGRAGVTQTLAPTIVANGNYFLRFRYAYYRQTGTGTNTFQVRAFTGINSGCVPVIGTPVFTESVSITNTLSGLVWQTRTIPFTPTAPANTLSLEIRATGMGPNTRIMFYVDDVEIVRYPCRQDLNGDGVVGTDDLLIMVGYSGSSVNAIANLCHAGADINMNGTVDAADFSALQGVFGPCGTSGMVAEAEPSATPSSATDREAQLIAMPNPNNGHFSLYMPSNEAGSPVVVHGTDGKAVRTYRSTGDARLELDLSDLPDGLYAVRLSTAEGDHVVRVVKE